MRHRNLKHKHDQGRGGGGVNLGLIITPMLDMAFQLLAFFVMTYHPSALEGHIDGTLAPPKKIATKGPKSDPQDLSLAVDEEPKAADALLVTVKAVEKGKIEGDRADGDPRWVDVKRPEAVNPITINGNSSLPREAFVRDLAKELDRELKKLLAETGKSTDIKLEADNNLKHRYWMVFYDTCKLAGFQNIHFVAPEPERK